MKKKTRKEIGRILAENQSKISQRKIQKKKKTKQNKTKKKQKKHKATTTTEKEIHNVLIKKKHLEEGKSK